MISEDIAKASLAELREMKNRGKIRSSAPEEDDALPPEFWEEAELSVPPHRTSVHLKLEPEVFDFFKSQGKGHLTRMQNVLKAYVRARKQTK